LNRWALRRLAFDQRRARVLDAVEDVGNIAKPHWRAVARDDNFASLRLNSWSLVSGVTV
jgi:hypothetical protein